MDTLPPNESRGPLLLGTTTTLLVLALVTFGMRIWTRMVPNRILGWDDYTMSIAVVCAIVTWVLEVMTVVLGFGKHTMNVDPRKITLILHYNFALQAVWLWGVTFVKVSLGFMILRIMKSRAWQWFMYSVIAVIISLAAVSTALELTQCLPMRANWNFLVPNPRCRSQRNVSISVYFSITVFVVSDLLFSLLPLAFILKIQMPLYRKIAIGVLMGLGLVASSTALARLTMVKNLQSPIDPSWNQIPYALLAMAEMYIGIFTACIPPLRSTFTKQLRRMGVSLSSTQGSTNKSKQYDASSKFGTQNSKTWQRAPSEVSAENRLHAEDKAMKTESLYTLDGPLEMTGEERC